MPLINCRHCGKPISDTAKMCPACGASGPVVIAGSVSGHRERPGDILIRLRAAIGYMLESYDGLALGPVICSDCGFTTPLMLALAGQMSSCIKCGNTVGPVCRDCISRRLIDNGCKDQRSNYVDAMDRSCPGCGKSVLVKCGVCDKNAVFALLRLDNIDQIVQLNQNLLNSVDCGHPWELRCRYHSGYCDRCRHADDVNDFSRDSIAHETKHSPSRCKWLALLTDAMITYCGNAMVHRKGNIDIPLYQPVFECVARRRFEGGTCSRCGKSLTWLRSLTNTPYCTECCGL